MDGTSNKAFLDTESAAEYPPKACFIPDGNALAAYSESNISSWPVFGMFNPFYCLVQLSDLFTEMSPRTSAYLSAYLN